MNKYNTHDFLHYPEIDDKDFYKILNTKREFYETKSNKDKLEKETVEELCDKKIFKLKSEQEFIRNFMSDFTPYKSILAYWGVGVGKSCASINIAEESPDKITYIIGRKQVKNAFMKDLYSFDKEREEEEYNIPPGNLQCTGNRYFISRSEEPDEKVRQHKIVQNIKKKYKFFGMQGFANFADVRVKKENFNSFFSNCNFIIDEAHSLAGASKYKDLSEDEEQIFDLDFQELDDKVKVINNDNDNESVEDDNEFDNNFEDDFKDDNDMNNVQVDKLRNVSDRGILTILHDLIDNTVNTKFILLSATPMKDNERELADIFDILLHNDKSPLYPIDREKLFNKDENKEVSSINEDYLKEIAKGRVSYVRGEHPKIFPTLIDVDESKYKVNTYLPAPKYDIKKNKILKYEHIKYTPLIKCPMSEYQYTNYMDIVKEKIKKVNINNKNIDSIGREISNVIFPKNNIDANEKNYGIEGFNNNFSLVSVENFKSNDLKKHNKNNKYKYKSADNFLNIDKIGKYSSKIKTFMDIIFNTGDLKQGIIFTYSNYNYVGAVLIALALEENGYKKYKSQKVTEDIDLLYKEDRTDIINRCICGKLENDNTIHTNNETDNDNKHKFKQAYYCLFSGIVTDNNKYKDDELNALTHNNNKYGEKIKLVIGTVVASESYNFKRIRQVHIIDPWHNNTRLYQVIGRALRTCSHYDLDESERNVTVFKYCASGYKNEEIETSDETIYRRIERKDLLVKKIERILKMVSVDCLLNKELNLYGLDGKDGKRQCDYEKCEYKCQDEDKININEKKDLNYDTYNLYFSKPYISRAKKVIIDLFKFNFVLDLNSLTELIKNVDDKLTNEHIYEALDLIIKSKEIIIDRYNRKGYIIYTNPYPDNTNIDSESYYIFQPLDITDTKIPLYYKSTPLTIKYEKTPLDIDVENINKQIKRSYLSHSENVIKLNFDYTDAKIDNTINVLNNSDIFTIGYIIDHVYNLKKKIALFERSVLLFITNKKFANNKTIKNIIESFLRYDIVFKINDSQYAHNFDKYRYFNNGKWNDSTENEFVLFSKEKNNKVNDAIYRGYVEIDLKNNSSKFKIIDSTFENKVQNKVTTKNIQKVIYSKRNKLKGRECESYKLTELFNFAKKLNIDIIEGEAKEDLCITIELYLRKLDYESKDTNYFNIKLVR